MHSLRQIRTFARPGLLSLLFFFWTEHRGLERVNGSSRRDFLDETILPFKRTGAGKFLYSQERSSLDDKPGGARSASCSNGE